MLFFFIKIKEAINRTLKMYVHYSITFKCPDSFVSQNVVINYNTNVAKAMRF